MCCGSGLGSSSYRSSAQHSAGSRRRSQVRHQKHTWTVTYSDGTVKQWTGGRMEELAARREAATNPAATGIRLEEDTQ